MIERERETMTKRGREIDRENMIERERETEYDRDR